MSTLTSGAYTAHKGEEQEDYAVRLARVVSPAVSAEAETTHGGDLVGAIPLMILLTMAEKIAALGGPVATQDDIDVYELTYRTDTGPSIVIHNDQMQVAEDGHVMVAFRTPVGWLGQLEELEEVREYTDLDQAAVDALSLIRCHRSPAAARRAAYISGLRKLADLLEQHAELPLPYEGDRSPLSFHFLSASNPRAEIAAAARVLPGPLTKLVRQGSVYGDYFDLHGQIDGISFDLTAYRNDVCERVVTGTREVTKTVPDPSVEVPTVEITETVEDVEWVCSPVLAGTGA